MIRFAGHTMGVPKHDIFGAIQLFKQIGYDGIEVRVKEDGQINPFSYTPELGGRIKEHLAETGMKICCLTPYFQNFVHAERRASELAGFMKVVDIAADLGCPLVRSYGGIGVPPGADAAEYWDRTVSGIRECADYARTKNVSIAIETHIGSLTFSASDAARMVRAVGRTNVGILFDYAWVDLLGQETPEQAVNTVTPYLLHCHVKDWVIHDRAAMKKTSSLMGEGSVPWPAMLQMLAASGYDGYLSDEYEKYWYPHLPEAAVGMRRNLQYVKRILGVG